MLNFLLISDHSYFHTLSESITRINQLYPDCPIYLYDWGLTEEQVGYLNRNFKNIVIRDWKENIRLIRSGEKFYFPENRNEEEIRDLVLGFRNPNRLTRRWGRFKFSTLKSPSFRSEVFGKWILENIYLTKIQCQIDCCRLVGDNRVVFLDADAILVDTIDEVYREDFDFAFTLRRAEEINFTTNLCTVLNVGAIFFGADQGRRELFFREWWKKAIDTPEWIREQTSLTRLLSEQDGMAFEYDRTSRFAIGEDEIAIRILPCDKYNFNWIEEIVRDREKLKDVKVLHFKGGRHSADSFRELIREIGI